MIKSFMCIGAQCEGHEFAKVLGLRVKGPVDNLAATGFSAPLDLFSKKFINIVRKKEYVPYEKPEGGIGYEIGQYKMIHHDITLKKVYKELMERIFLFYKYLRKSKLNKDMYYLYTVCTADRDLSISDIKNILDKFPKHIRSRIIVLQTIIHNPNFEEFFPCIYYDNLKDFWDTVYTEKTVQVYQDFLKKNPTL